MGIKLKVKCPNCKSEILIDADFLITASPAKLSEIEYKPTGEAS